MPACNNPYQYSPTICTNCGLPNYQHETGMEFIRRVVRIMNDCNETFNDQFTPEEIIKLIRVHLQSEWDFYPDQWTDEQVAAAIHAGEVPRWDPKTEKPLPTTYQHPSKRTSND